MKKTLAEHLEFAESCAGLSFYMTYRLAPAIPVETMEFILRQRSPLYRIALGLDPDTPVDIFTRFPEAASAEEFENKMMLQCRDFILRRAEEQYPESHGMGLHGVWQAECFKFDPPSANTPKRCTFHIGNAKAPDSIFSDRNYILKRLLLMLDLMEKEYGVEELGTGTWLNSSPYWLRYFPPVWKEHMEDRPLLPQWHLGYWGQIITARGTFNEKNARYFREHLAMRYQPRYSWCLIRELRTHLRQMQEREHV